MLEQMDEMETGIAAAFREAAERHGIPAAVAIVADSQRPLAACAHGPVAPRSIFVIASMTKAITTAAALQLVERGALGIDEPVDVWLAELRDLHVLEGFDAGGAPRFSRERYRVTLRQLLTHTAGFAYPWNHPLAQRYGKREHPVPFLVHEPGSEWQYGTNIDWVGKLVEEVSKQGLEEYFRQHIFLPLQMLDTSFLLAPEKLHRLAPMHQRDADGALVEAPCVQPPAPSFFNGGGGLYSTAEDYIRFLQMILQHGVAETGIRILQASTVLAMSTNQLGDMEAGRIHSTMPLRSRDVDFHPGASDRFGLGFLINQTAYEGGRSAGSLGWGGIRNTFYWIDPARGIATVLLMQFQPFCDNAAMGMLRDFEHAVYSHLP